MIVEVTKDSARVTIQYQPEGDPFTWRINKQIYRGADQPEPARFWGPQRFCTAERAEKQALLLKLAAGIARQLDEAITERGDFKAVEVIEMEGWAGDESRIARIQKRGGAVFVMIPKQ
jgi:hypothetical protein